MPEPRIKISVCNLKSPAGCYSKIKVVDPYEKFVIGAESESISETYICGINLWVPFAHQHGGDLLSTESMLKCPYREERTLSCPGTSEISDVWLGDCDDCSHHKEDKSPYCYYCSVATHSNFQKK